MAGCGYWCHDPFAPWPDECGVWVVAAVWVLAVFCLVVVALVLVLMTDSWLGGPLSTSRWSGRRYRVTPAAIASFFLCLVTGDLALSRWHVEQKRRLGGWLEVVGGGWWWWLVGGGSNWWLVVLCWLLAFLLAHWLACLFSSFVACVIPWALPFRFVNRYLCCALRCAAKRIWQRKKRNIWTAQGGGGSFQT